MKNFTLAKIEKTCEGHPMSWNCRLLQKVNGKIYYTGNGKFFKSLEKAKEYAAENAENVEICE